jgi:hypothetical protein
MREIVKPEQLLAGGDARTELTYGPHRVHLRETVNELGHSTVTVHDLATGALTERRGPNAVSVGGAVRREGKVVRRSRVHGGIKRARRKPYEPLAIPGVASPTPPEAGRDPTDDTLEHL